MAISEGREHSKCRVACSNVKNKTEEVVCGHSVVQSTHNRHREDCSEPEPNTDVVQESCGAEKASVPWSGSSVCIRSSSVYEDYMQMVDIAV